MANVQTKRNYGPSGLAKVNILKNGVRVSFKDGDIYDIPGVHPDEIPESGEYVITMSADKTKIMGVKPVAGQYILRFKRFGNRSVGRSADKEGLPTNKVTEAKSGVSKKTGKPYQIPKQLVFIAEVEIADGPYAGLTVTTNIPYSFTMPMTGDMTDYSDTQGNLEKLETFFVCATGKNLASIDIPYSPEPPQLLMRYEKFMNDNERFFLGNTNENGFLDLKSLSPLPESLMPKKKAVKKPTAKKGSK